MSLPARSASTRRAPIGTAWTGSRSRPWRNGSPCRWRARCPFRWFMSKLSAYVLTFNEEGKIRGTLDSLTWADEIVVLDSHSTDHTRSEERRVGKEHRQRRRCEE